MATKNQAFLGAVLSLQLVFHAFACSPPEWTESVVLPPLEATQAMRSAEVGLPIVGCGFVETTANGPWVFATATGSVGSTCGEAIDRCLSGNKVHLCDSYLSPCRGDIRFFRVADGRNHAFAFPLNAVDTRGVETVFFRPCTDVNWAFKRHNSPWDDFASMQDLCIDLDWGFAYELGTSYCIDLDDYVGVYQTCLSSPSYMTGVSHIVGGTPGEFVFVYSGSPLEFSAQAPIDLREKQNALAHHTDRYKLVENPDRMIVRRAAAFQVEVTGESELDEQCSLIHFTATHTFDGDPVEIDIPLFEGSVVPADAWGCRVVHVEGRDPKKLLVEVSIPKDAAIGEYAFKAQFRPNGRPEFLDEVEFPKKLVVLFNPWNSLDAVGYFAPAELDGYLLDECQVIGKREIGDDIWWGFDQFNEVVLDGTFALLESLTAGDRADPAKVSRQLIRMLNAGRVTADGVADTLGEGVLIGNLSTNFFQGVDPRFWKSSAEVFWAWRTAESPIGWGQCWVYAGLATSSLRTLGIASRTVSCIDAGRDLQPPFDGSVRVVKMYDPVKKDYVASAALSDGQWDFHVWTEGWFRRADLDGAVDWQALDATPARASGMTQYAGPAAQHAILGRVIQDFDTPHFWALANGDILTVHQGGSGDPTIKKVVLNGCGTYFRTQNPTVPGAFQMITPVYNPWGPHQGTPYVVTGPAEWASVETPQQILPGDSVSITIRVHNRDPVSRTFVVAWRLNYATNGISATGEIAGQDGQPYLLDAGETRDLSVTVPWTAVAPGLKPEWFLRAHASVVCEEADVYWSEDPRVWVSPLPVTLTASPSGNVRFNDLVSLDLRFRNAGSDPTLGTVAEFAASRGARFANNETDLQVNLGTVAGGADVHVVRAVRTTEKGPLTIVGRVMTNNASAQTVGVRLNVVGCLGDLDGGDSVDDADFSLFVQAYDALLVPPADPASDLNRDGLVDDLDFMLFVQAYNQLTCD